MKNELTVRELVIKVNGKGLDFFKNNKQVATVDFFNNNEINNNKIVLRFNEAYGEAKGSSGILVTEEEYQELLTIKVETEKAIDNFFSGLEKVELNVRSGYYNICNMNEEIEELNNKYFKEASNKWIQENKKHFVKSGKWVQTEIGTMEMVTTCTFVKENIAAVKEVKKENKNYIDVARMMELAEKLNDEDFEDMTGLPREYYFEGM